MTEEIAKEEVQELIKIKGNARGAILLAHAIFIQKKKGPKNLRAVEKISVEETKCVFKGAPYHEYLIRWE